METVIPSIAFLPAIIISLILLLVFIWLISERKTKIYRKQLADLYVAGRIRQLALEDKIDLVAEYESFKQWAKKQNIGYQELDDTVESELKERVEEKIII